MSSIRICIDAMGGDYAPEEVVKGTFEYIKENKDIDIILTGNRNHIQKICEDNGFPLNKVEVVHTEQVIEMNESPVIALKKKKNSSINIAMNLAKEKKADAVVSMGNTGVVVASASLLLRNLPGVKRAGIGIPMPTFVGKPCIMIDMGANINCKPENLLQYAIMASVYGEKILGIKDPKIGLLNIGEEDSKGNELTKETYKLLSQSTLNFIGNIEGGELFTGKCDVVVCDGFVGNIVLKTAEGVAEGMLKSIRELLSANIRRKIGAFLVKDAFLEMIKNTHFSEFGGAPLLGIDGIIIIGHGRSKATAVKNAIRVAVESVKNNINDEIVKVLNKEEN